MLNPRNLNIYKDELISENNIGLRFIQILEPAIVQNKRFTSGLVPKSTKSIKDLCWIDQWMALSGNSTGRCRCAVCGKFIFADTSDLECIKMASAYKTQGIISDCTPETLQIQGGHIILTKDIVNGSFILAKKGSTHIVPLCKKCNNFTVSTLILQAGSIITPEIRC